LSVSGRRRWSDNLHPVQPRVDEEAVISGLQRPGATTDFYTLLSGCGGLSDIKAILGRLESQGHPLSKTSWTTRPGLIRTRSPTWTPPSARARSASSGSPGSSSSSPRPRTRWRAAQEGQRPALLTRAGSSPRPRGAAAPEAWAWGASRTGRSPRRRRPGAGSPTR